MSGHNPCIFSQEYSVSRLDVISKVSIIPNFTEILIGKFSIVVFIIKDKIKATNNIPTQDLDAAICVID